MSAAADAYKAAQAEIARAKATGEDRLRLDETAFRALQALPPEIAELDGLRQLDLDNTQIRDMSPLAGMQTLLVLYLDRTKVSDITPLAGMQSLQALYLNGTQVSDIAPVAGMQSLRELYLTGTLVSDLRPILSLESLGKQQFRDALRFQRCAATEADAELKRLSEIEDGDERLTETQAYLRSLPPWPEPLPWSPDPTQGDTPPDPPSPELGLAMAMIEGCLEVTPHPHGPDDDPLRSKSFARLRDAVTGLVRHGNRYPELRPIVDTLLTQTEGTLAEASLYDIHLDIGALSDLLDGNAARPEAEKIDSECLTAIKAVTRLGPPLTMNDPEVIAFEEAHARYAGKPKGATEARGEERVVEQISKGGDGIGPGLQNMAARVAAQPVAPGRMATARALLTKNTVIYAGLAVLGVSTSAIWGHITVEAAKAAWAAAPGIWQFLVANKDSIMAAAAGWGDQAQVWTADLLGRAVEISNLRHGRRSSTGDNKD